MELLQEQLANDRENPSSAFSGRFFGVWWQEPFRSVQSRRNDSKDKILTNSPALLSYSNFARTLRLEHKSLLTTYTANSSTKMPRKKKASPAVKRERSESYVPPASGWDSTSTVGPTSDAPTHGMELRSSKKAKQRSEPVREALTKSKRPVPCIPCLQTQSTWQRQDGDPPFYFGESCELTVQVIVRVRDERLTDDIGMDTCERCKENGDECEKPKGFLSGHAYILHQKLSIDPNSVGRIFSHTLVLHL